MTTNSYAMRPVRAGEAPAAVVSSAYARRAYAVPDDDATPGYDQDGYSPGLGEQSEGNIPDPIRVQKAEPLFGGPTQHNIHLRRGLDNIHRRDDEMQISTGWTTRQEKPVIAVIPEQVQDIGPSRPTAAMGPNNQLFMRPWDRPPEDFTGEHLSMADHRRKYEIYGMKPQGDVGVNTYRKDPAPWDTNLHYNPPRVPTETQAAATAALSIGGNRNYRL